MATTPQEEVVASAGVETNPAQPNFGQESSAAISLRDIVFGDTDINFGRDFSSGLDPTVFHDVINTPDLDLVQHQPQQTPAMSLYSTNRPLAQQTTDMDMDWSSTQW